MVYQSERKIITSAGDADTKKKREKTICPFSFASSPSQRSVRGLRPCRGNYISTDRPRKRLGASPSQIVEAPNVSKHVLQFQT